MIEPKFERLSGVATISRHKVALGITAEIVGAKSHDAKSNPRKREILALHRGSSDRLQRMINAIEPGSYVRPHRHHAPPNSESLVLLSGSIGFVPFLEDGTPDHENFVLLHRTAGAIALDCRESVWHTLFALEPNTAFYEAKPGPYDPNADKGFAPWAPAEDAPEALSYLDWLESEFRSRFPAVKTRQ